MAADLRSSLKNIAELFSNGALNLCLGLYGGGGRTIHRSTEESQLLTGAKMGCPVQVQPTSAEVPESPEEQLRLWPRNWEDELFFYQPDHTWLQTAVTSQAVVGTPVPSTPALGPEVPGGEGCGQGGKALGWWAPASALWLESPGGGGGQNPRPHI